MKKEVNYNCKHNNYVGLRKSEAKSMPKDAISTAKHTSFIIPDKHGLKNLNCRVIFNCAFIKYHPSATVSTLFGCVGNER
jgi:hypothetical protein